MSTQEKILLWIARFGVFLLPFICLYIANPLFFPFITGKNFAFRIIVEIMTGAWFALALINPVYRPKRSWILATFALFIFVIAIADAQGVNPFKSFLSNFERMDGWITIVHLFAYFVVASIVMNTEKLWRWLFKMSLGISFFVTLYGFTQIIGVTSLGEGGVSGLTSRIDATFGNPIYLAVYMLFHIFIAAMLWAQMWVAYKQGKRMWGSIAYGSVIVFDTIALFFTGTRGTIIGLVGGVLLTALIMVFLARKSRNVWRGAVIAICGVLIVSGGFFSMRNASWVHDIGFLQRLATISTSDNTVKARFLNWGIAWKGVQERPVLGWGQENYAIVFDKYYDPRMYAQEAWFDRVHNVVFDWLVAGGFIGLLAYLSIFATTLWVLWKSKTFTIAERSILTGLLAGYFCHNFFVFDNVTSYILFGTILAFIAWRESTVAETKTVFAKFTLPKAAAPIVVVVLIAVTGVTVWEVNAAPLNANLAILTALQSSPQGLQGNLDSFEQAISYNSFGTQEAREQMIQIASEIANNTQVSNSTKEAFVNAALSQMILQSKASPLDARFPLFIGVTEDTYGDYKDAAAALEKAHELSPDKQGILFEQGFNAQAQGDNAGALATFKTAYELDTEDVQAQVYYAAAAILANDQTLATQLLAPLIPTGDAADMRVASAYASKKQYNKIIPIWKTYLTLHPNDNPQAYVTLASAYYGMGDSKDAIATLQTASSAIPSMADQAASFIAQIKSGSVQR